MTSDELATEAVRAAAARDMGRYFELLDAYDAAVAAEDAGRDGGA